MRILYTLPGISNPHGGYRIVCEHLTRLKKLGHETALFVENRKTECGWYNLSGITVTGDRRAFKRYDIIVIGSPHSIWIEDYIRPDQKCFLFMQMVEEKFRPNDVAWHRLCMKFYMSRFPIIHGSRWGEDHVRNMGRKGVMYYIGNGVNFDHFPIITKSKDGKTILLESPFSGNPAKDVDQLALNVAIDLKKNHPEVEILGYGADFCPPKYERYFDNYSVRPSIGYLNYLYDKASILIKATRYDARALSPVEAMTKGCVTARAIVDGDDDLTHNHNCLKTGYNIGCLLQSTTQLLSDEGWRQELARNARNYVQEHCNWGKIIKQLNDILCS